VKNLDPVRAKWIRVRMGILSAIMALGLGGLVASAFRVQVEDHVQWKETAENQRTRRLHIEPKRGTISDRNGTPLAVTVEVPSLSVDVIEMLRGTEDRSAQALLLNDVAQKLSVILGLDLKETYAKLVTRRRFIWLKRRISNEEGQAIRELSDPKRLPKPIRGLNLEGEGHRYYPGREILGPVLGFVAPDGQGKDGLELSLNDELKGRVQDVRGLRDRAGRLIFSDGNEQSDALAGNDVTLSIDEGIQSVVEHELDSAQGTYETKGASLVVMDPNTGEILALAATPGYNPNDYNVSEVESRRDRAVTDRFEPGSVMKVFTMAAALAANTIKPTEPIFCEHGTFQLGNVTIHDTHLNDWLTPTQILARSSNIGTLKIALRLGEPGLYAAFRGFGFGEPTGLPLPGEASGVLRPKARPWFEVETANASFGQGISVSTIQLALAMSAIANGGRLYEPILVKRVVDSRGNVIKEVSPTPRRDVVPASVAKTVAEMLTAVVEDGGTGIEAAVPGFRVAGKTATAQKADPATGKYSEDKYVASFLGFVPAENPRLVIAIVLDEPMIGRYGGDLAGPVFRRVAESSLRYLGVTPSKSAPRVSQVKREGDPADNALALFKANAAAPQETLIQAPFGPPAANSSKIPDAQGLPAREAIRVISAAGFVPHVDGTGKLVRQWPAPGTAAPRGSAVRLVFEPAS
jgi:cell division protein FtsI (penicillin-binding protein 3)